MTYELDDRLRPSTVDWEAYGQRQREAQEERDREERERLAEYLRTHPWARHPRR